MLQTSMCDPPEYSCLKVQFREFTIVVSLNQL